MKRLSILMYHGLYADERQRQAIDAIDRPYAISAQDFACQLDLLLQAGVPVVHPGQLEQGGTTGGGVLLTFDDGHASNVELALPLLKQRGLSAAFFITTDFVGKRPGFCTWDQVRTLADNGMVVGGHGHTHRFLSDLPDDALRAELTRSHLQLEQELRRWVKQMSFPGGRYDARCIDFARAAGYTVLHGSDVGTLAGHRAGASVPLPRLAIRAGIPPPVFMDYARARPLRMVRMQAASRLKSIAKELIGNQRYHRLYARFKGETAPRP